MYVCVIKQFIVRLTHTSIWESTGSYVAALIESHSHARILISINYSHENLYQVLQVTCAMSECGMKSKFYMIKLLSP